MEVELLYGKLSKQWFDLSHDLQFNEIVIRGNQRVLAVSDEIIPSRGVKPIPWGVANLIFKLKKRSYPSEVAQLISKLN